MDKRTDSVSVNDLFDYLTNNSINFAQVKPHSLGMNWVNPIPAAVATALQRTSSVLAAPEAAVPMIRPGLSIDMRF